MKKILIVLAVLAFSAGFAFAGPDCGAHAKPGKKAAKAEMKCGMEACCVEGSEVKVENTKDGVKITITSKDPEAVKKIQEKAEKMKNCPMKGSKSAAADGEDTAVCPVMGTKVNKNKAYAVKEYKGKKYYLCCAGCVKEFDKNPEKYAK